MPNISHSEPLPPSSVWIIWGALLFGVIILPFLVFGGLPSGSDKGTPSAVIYVLTFAGFIVSVLIRCFVLPKKKSDEQLLTTMVIGMAMAEGTGILGLAGTGRDYVSIQIAAYTCSIIGVLLFIPTYYPAEKKKAPNS